MKKISITLMFLLCGHEVPTYVEFRSGPCFPTKEDRFKFQTTINPSFELGYRTEVWRFGVQFGYLKFDVKNQDEARIHFFSNKVKARSYLFTYIFNIYRDIEVGRHWKFYIGLGGDGVRYRVLQSHKLHH